VVECPHCGGKLEILVPADATDDAWQARDRVIDDIAAWANAQARMIRGVGLGKATEDPS
jgi:hypothetical protein